MTAPGYKQIRGLNVSMNNAFHMGGFERVGYVDGDGDNTFCVQGTGGD